MTLPPIERNQSVTPEEIAGNAAKSPPLPVTAPALACWITSPHDISKPLNMCATLCVRRRLIKPK
ncbi:MAG: hypothetical protein LBK76_08280 [Verrucomicrobiales bacterium]|jgi:hypothetical protein|nr:hypothetical protein [Verrucomicrobiales bacterium]